MSEPLHPRDSDHEFGDSEAVEAPLPASDLRFYIYAAACRCGAVEVSTRDHRIAIVSANEVALSAELP